MRKSHDHRRDVALRPAASPGEARSPDVSTARHRAPFDGEGPRAHNDGDAWVETDAGPLVRPYTMTAGRTRPSDTGLDMISIVVAVGNRVDPSTLGPEHAAILDLCRGPTSVAELAAQLDIPMAVVKVILSDLIAKGDVLTRAPLPTADLPEMNILQAVLDGIRRL